MTRPPRSSTLPIFSAFFVMGFTDAVGTLVGFAEREFHLSGARAGLLPFFGFIAFALVSVPAGVVADRHGKLRLLIGSLGAVLVGEVLASLSVARFDLLLGAIFLIGAGMAALQVAGNPIMRDVSAPGRYARNLTFAQFIKSLGSIAGPYLTPLVIAAGFAWYRIFPVFAAVILLTLLLALSLRRGRTAGDPVSDRAAPGVGASLALLADPGVALAVGGIFLYVGAEVGLNSWLATALAGRFGMPLASTATRLGPGLFFIALAAGRLGGSAVLNFIGARRFFLATTLIGLAGLVLLLAGPQPLAIAGIACCGLGFANVWPLVFALTVESRPERSGALSGLMCMAVAGGALLPLLMGLLADHAGLRVAFVPALVTFVYLTVLAVAWQRRGAAPGGAGFDPGAAAEPI